MKFARVKFRAKTLKNADVSCERRYPFKKVGVRLAYSGDTDQIAVIPCRLQSFLAQFAIHSGLKHIKFFEEVDLCEG